MTLALPDKKVWVGSLEGEGYKLRVSIVICEPGLTCASSTHITKLGLGPAKFFYYFCASPAHNRIVGLGSSSGLARYGK